MEGLLVTAFVFSIVGVLALNTNRKTNKKAERKENFGFGQQRRINDCLVYNRYKDALSDAYVLTNTEYSDFKVI